MADTVKKDSVRKRCRRKREDRQTRHDNKASDHTNIGTYVSYLCSGVTLFLFLSTEPVDSWRKLGFNLYNS